MTRREQRLKAIEKEKLIRRLRREGLSCREIAKRLGVTVQRIYNFTQQAKHRPPLADRINALRAEIRDDRTLGTSRRIYVNPGHFQSALHVLNELRELLLHSQFYSTSLAGKRVRSLVIVIGKTRKTSRGASVRDSVANIVKRVRVALLAGAEAVLVRRREQTPAGVIRRQVWVFSFSKS